MLKCLGPLVGATTIFPENFIVGLPLLYCGKLWRLPLGGICFPGFLVYGREHLVTHRCALFFFSHFRSHATSISPVALPNFGGNHVIGHILHCMVAVVYIPGNVKNFPVLTICIMGFVDPHRESLLHAFSSPLFAELVGFADIC